MGIMPGFMRKVAIKWIKVRIMSVHFYVLLRNFLEDFRKDQISKFLKFVNDNIGYYKYYEGIASTKTNVGTRKLPMMEDVLQCFRAI